jgi:NADH-quinone oxidoreductase subunit A
MQSDCCFVHVKTPDGFYPKSDVTCIHLRAIGLFSTLTAVDLLLSITIFTAFGALFVFANLTLGSFARPKLPNAEKSAVYECGEPSEGESWVQFDLRFYIIALVFLVFDVEVSLFYPWAVAWGNAAEVAARIGLANAFELRKIALVDMLFFFGVLLVGFAYLWRFGYLDWVRSSASTSLKIRSFH